MKIKIILLIFALTILSCKKDKLAGNDAQLDGTWRWFGGYDDGGNADLKLLIKDKGKYKLYRGNKKIEHGRLQYESGYVKFISDDLFSKSAFNTDGRSIQRFQNDTINIYKVFFTDQPTSGFVRQ